jgi:hypothetical protein
MSNAATEEQEQMQVTAYRLAHRVRVRREGRGCMRNCVHHRRAFFLGVWLLSLLAYHNPRLSFPTYEEFLRWAGVLLNCSPATVRKSLKHVGLWRRGKRGVAGGASLEQMVEDIAFYPRFCVDERLFPFHQLNDRKDGN